MRAVPGVESAALVRAVPFSGNGGTVGYAVEGRPAPDPASAPQARFHLVTPDYFKTMKIPLLKGRDFTDRDDLQTPLVSVINETFARRAWPGEDPIGKRFTTPQTHGPVTVIGVVGDTKHYTATEPAVPQLYAAHYQVPLIFSSLVARTRGPEMAITDEVQQGDLGGRQGPADVGGALARIAGRGDAGLDAVSRRRCSGSSRAWRCCWPASASTA